MRPPRLASWLVGRAAGPERAPYVLSDLAEEFEHLAVLRGWEWARRWYWRQALTSLMPLAGIDSLGLTRLRLRDSLAVFRRSPAMALAIVTTFALGIGANTAVFSLVDAVLLTPLPYREADRLVSLWEQRPDAPRTPVAAGNFVDYRNLSGAFQGVAAYVRATRMVGAEAPEEVAVELVTADLFEVLGVFPAAGRTLGDGDARPGAERVVILSDTFWRQRYQGDAAVIGTSMSINKAPHRIVGIMRDDFRALSEYASAIPVALFLPLQEMANPPRGDHVLQVVARLRDGATVEQARRELDVVSATLAAAFPGTNGRVAARLAPLGADVARRARATLWVVGGAVSLIVLIACVNVANLLLVWATGRNRDVAIRLALGASRADIVVEHLVRGLALGLVGGAAGVVAGLWVRDALVALAPPAVLPRVGPITLNARVLLVGLGLSVVSGLAASVLPALHLTRRRVAPLLHDGSQSAGTARSIIRWRGGLLVIEVAAAVVLALGAGLLIRSAVNLDRIALGYDTARIATMSIPLPATRFADADAKLRFYEALSERVRQIPGVEAVTFANQFPMRGGWGGAVLVESPAGSIEGEAELQAVGPGYFETLGIRIRRGRGFLPEDRDTVPGVVVVSETFAARFLPGLDPLGRIVRRHATAPPLTVVGVVGEVRRDGKFSDVMPQMYFSARQTSLYASGLSSFAVRAQGDPLALVPHVRRAVADLDGGLVVSGVRTLDEILNASVASLRFHTWLLALLAMLALGLAVVGVYGVVNYTVVQRTREIGVRVALGASRAHVMAVVVGAGLRWTAAGIAVGALLAAGASHMLSTLLFNTTTHDPLTFAGVAALVGLVGLLAAYAPARRALSVNPVAALRGE